METDTRTNFKTHKEPNKNATWLSSPGAWISYVLILALARIFLSGLGLSELAAWTLWNTLHSIITFICIHWVKGTPFSHDVISESKYDKLTLWEQIDSGVQFTPTRKFFTMVPIIVYLMTSHYTSDNLPSFVLNTSAFLLVFIAKLPFLYKKRIFGINS